MEKVVKKLIVDYDRLLDYTLLEMGTRNENERYFFARGNDCKNQRENLIKALGIIEKKEPGSVILVSEKNEGDNIYKIDKGQDFSQEIKRIANGNNAVFLTSYEDRLSGRLFAEDGIEVYAYLIGLPGKYTEMDLTGCVPGAYTPDKISNILGRIMLAEIPSNEEYLINGKDVLEYDLTVGSGLGCSMMKVEGSEDLEKPYFDLCAFDRYGNIVGGATISMIMGDEKPESVILEDLYVPEQNRRNGIGSALLKNAEDIALKYTDGNRLQIADGLLYILQEDNKEFSQKEFVEQPDVSKAVADAVREAIHNLREKGAFTQVGRLNAISEGHKHGDMLAEKTMVWTCAVKKISMPLNPQLSTRALDKYIDQRFTESVIKEENQRIVAETPEELYEYENAETLDLDEKKEGNIEEEYMEVPEMEKQQVIQEEPEPEIDQEFTDLCEGEKEFSL